MPRSSERVRGAAGLYLHFPFCSVRCTYCDFPTVAGRDDSIDVYLDSLVAEIRRGQPGLPGRVDTVYLGGGTPSRMRADQVARVLRAVRDRFDLARDAEITIEGNPESLTAGRLAGYRAAGVTRVSVGVQSLDDAVLRRVGRAHDASEALSAIQRVHDAGFLEANVDLIAGLPGEKLDGWESTLEHVLATRPEHVSVYLLETDKETPLARSVGSGRTRLACDDSVAEVYDRTVVILDAAGFEHYEISNFSRPARQSRHNLKYWTDSPYGGFGLGAHGYDGRVRRANRRDLDGYVGDVQSGRDPASWEDPWDARRRLGEALFLGLRLLAGVDLDAVSERYDIDVRRTFGDTWDRGEEAGMLEWSGSHVRLTHSGRLRSNELFAELV